MRAASIVSIHRQTHLQKQMETIADNIANATRPGFQAQTLKIVSEEKAGKLKHALHLSNITGVERDLSAGKLKTTGNDLDFSLNGAGYFVVQTPRGERYTRDGQFQLNEQRQIVNASGYIVADEGGSPIVIPEDARSITVDKEGNVFTGNQAHGRFSIVTFENEQKMQREGQGLFSSEAPSTPALTTRVYQGGYEVGNVNLIEEIVHMIDVHRQYEANQNLIEKEDERRKSAITGVVRNA